MSRIGKKPITIPAGIEVTVNGTLISVKKGNNVSTVETHGRVGIEVANGQVILTRNGDTKESSAFWGTYRALTANAINGLHEGFTKSLEINGVGYRATLKGDILELALGYSHPINYEIPKGLEITVEKNTVSVKGADKQQVGQAAAIIRGFRKPEPYKGKGVKYTDEKIIRKAGKTSKK
ncbi:50S ribosomal protein L6 [Aliarcobacter butzleri]|uniref:50S ribosomal protein L6 n=1 Tax=Aliarcobacter butzleri TaxID=28197 RepID=UPI001ED9EC05|nr:50S ribosomal protein L6 [Aliarcobacter butzleri]MCG3684193.1 50S ribosomal protein L6 [Aliarcobacter butzleri]